MPPEWIDYNGHMMDAYYFLAFTEATEAFLDHVGLGAAYQARTGSGIYTAESHLCFLSGVGEGAALEYQTQLLGHDSKRMHVFHRMASPESLAATCELMFLHVSDGRVWPMPPEAAAAVAALAARHAALPRPDRAGRHIAMPQGGSHPGGGSTPGPPGPGEVSEWDGASPMGRYVGQGEDDAGEACGDAARVVPGEGASATAGAEPWADEPGATERLADGEGSAAADDPGAESWAAVADDAGDTPAP